MTRPLLALSLAFAAASALAGAAVAQPSVTLPGLSYQVLASGPADGKHPTRSDSVQMRYIGKLSTGETFSTSPDDGKGISTFAVNGVIPGMSAGLQLMRPGDRWKITMPPYLAYGPGRPLNAAPPPGAPAGQAIQKQGIPPNATLIFEVELVAILPPKAP